MNQAITAVRKRKFEQLPRARAKVVFNWCRTFFPRPVYYLLASANASLFATGYLLILLPLPRLIRSSIYLDSPSGRPLAFIHAF